MEENTLESRTKLSHSRLWVMTHKFLSVNSIPKMLVKTNQLWIRICIIICFPKYTLISRQILMASLTQNCTNTHTQHHAWSRAFTITMLVSSLFWVFTQCWLVVVYRCLGAVYRSHIRRSSGPTTWLPKRWGRTGSAETLVNNCNQHRVKTQKSKYSNFMPVKKKKKKDTLQYYSWIRTFQGSILPLSSELKFSVIFPY